MKHSGLLVLAAAALLTLYLLATGTKQESQYQLWKQKYQLDYSPSEDAYRESIFLSNLRMFAEHNSNPNRTYNMGINALTATTKQEWRTLHLRPVNNIDRVNIDKSKSVPNGPSVDWQAQGAVTKVISQGSCNAEYAFSAVGGAEGVAAIYFRSPMQLSVQQVVDCSSSYGNYGCEGGTVDNAYDFIIARGLMSATDYPYNGGPMGCKAQSGTFKKIGGYRKISNCNDLASVLVKQPLSVSIDGGNILYYQGGIFSDCDYDPNYGVLLTGMTDNYWRIRLSIAPDWGEKGYARLARDNTCGICMAARQATPAA